MLRKFIVFFSFIVSIQSDFRDPIYPVENPCLAILTRLSQVSSDFLSCAVSRSRPFKLCEGCVTSYGELQDLIDLLTRVKTDQRFDSKSIHFFRLFPMSIEQSRVKVFWKVTIRFN